MVAQRLQVRPPHAAPRPRVCQPCSLPHRPCTAAALSLCCGLIPPTYRGVVRASVWEPSCRTGSRRAPVTRICEDGLRIQWEGHKGEKALAFSYSRIPNVDGFLGL